MESTLEAAFATYCAPSARASLPAALKQPLTTLSARVASQRTLWSNGNVARSLRQTSCYYRLARWLAQRRRSQEHVAAPLTACEVGFNVGHSAIVFLSALGPGARYVGFELSEDSPLRSSKARWLVPKAAALLNCPTSHSYHLNNLMLAISH